MRLSTPVACLCVGAVASVSFGQIVWDGASGGLFGDDGNWVGGVAPGVGDSVLINQGGAYTINFDADVETSLLSMNGEDVTFDLGGFTYTLNSAYPDNSPTIGNTSSPSSLTLLNGTFAAQRIALGQINFPAAGSYPSLTIGAGAVVQSDLIWLNGNVGSSLLIHDGAQVNMPSTNGSIAVRTNNAAATGNVTITGAGTTVSVGSSLRIAEVGNGSAEISGGATFNGSINMTSGSVTSPVQNGSLRITGAGTTANLTNFASLAKGTADVLIDNQALVRVTNSFGVGNGGGVFTVSGAGSRVFVDNGRGIRIAARDGLTATMRVENGAALDVAAYSGNDIGSNGDSGELIVTGIGSRWTNVSPPIYPTLPAQDIYVGGSYGPGNGIVRIQSGATAMTEGAVFIGETAGSTGLVELTGAGSRWDIGTSLTIGNLGDAELFLGNGTLVTADTASIGAMGRITGDGGILRLNGGLGVGPGGSAGGRGTIEGGVMNGGLVTPGDPLGTLVITGAFDQAAGGTLMAQLSNAKANAADMLEVMGAATLAGELAVELLPGYVPAAGETFTILTAVGGLGGTTFDTETLPALDGGYSMSVVYTADSVQLVVVPVPASLAVLGLGVLGSRRRR